MDGRITSKQSIFVKIAGLCGIFGPIVFFISITLAIYFSPWFIWRENWLSDLGGIAGEAPIWAARGAASVIFNFGLLLNGVMGLMLASVIRKIKILKIHYGGIGSLFLIIDMFALFGVGLFPETTGYLHGIFSLIFFFLIPISLLCIGIQIKRSSRKSLGWFVTLIGAISLFSFPFLFIPQPLGGNAVVEMFPILSLSIFSMIFGIYLLKGNFELA